MDNKFFVGFTFHPKDILRVGLETILDDLELARVNKIWYLLVITLQHSITENQWHLYVSAPTA